MSDESSTRSTPALLLIGGEARPAADGATFVTYDPATGRPICEVAQAGAEDLDAALRSARAAFDTAVWSSVSATDRGHVLLRVAELIRERLAEILEIEPSAINEGDSFADDLDADSLALIELVEGIEEELSERTVGFRIEDEDLEDLKTVRDAVDYVFGRVSGS